MPRGDVVSGDGGCCCRVAVFPAAGRFVAVAPGSLMVACGRLNEGTAALCVGIVPVVVSSPTVDGGIVTELTMSGESVDMDGAAGNVATMTGSVERRLPICSLREGAAKTRLADGCIFASVVNEPGVTAEPGRSPSASKISANCSIIHLISCHNCATSPTGMATVIVPVRTPFV